jgi:hypothetical protein
MLRWGQSIGAPLGLFLLVLGLRWGALDFAGSALPFFDQWVAEYYNTLLRPSVGAVDWSGLLFVPHNEHRLVFTKLLVLASYSASGTYDVLLLGTLAAVLYGTLAVMVYGLLARGVSGFGKGLLWLATALFFAVPFSGYNVLCSMQVSFTLSQLGMVIALRAASRWSDDRSGAAGVLGGTLFGLANLGSGIVIPGAVLIVGALGPAAKRRAFWLAWGAAVLAMLYFVLVARSSAPGGDGAPVRFGLSMLAWPWSHPWLGGLSGAGFMVMLGVVLRRGVVCQGEPIRIAMGLFVFGAGNVLLLAMRRGPDEFHMRHWEIAALAPYALLALLLLVGGRVVARGWRRVWLGAAVVVTAFYGLGVAECFTDVSLPYYQASHEGRAAALERFRSELLKDGGVTLAREMPEAWEQMHRGVFDHPLWRHFMPEQIGQAIGRHPRIAIGLLTPSVFPGPPPSMVSRTAGALRHGWWLIASAGLGFAAVGLGRGRTSGREKEAGGSA